MTDFSRLDRADSFFDAVCGRIAAAFGRAGAEAWNHAPELRATRERACRVLVRSVNRREREAGALIARGVPERAVRARLQDNATARHRARTRS